MLDQVLRSRTFLVGERLSLADLAMATTLLPAFRSHDSFGSPCIQNFYLRTLNCLIKRYVLDEEWRSQHRHLVRWWNTVLHQVYLSDVFGVRLNLPTIPILFVVPIIFVCLLRILVCCV